MSTVTTLGPRKMKALEKEIDNSYGKYMSGIQVNIMNLGKVTKIVKQCVIEKGMTIEQGYEEAKGLFREN